MKKIFIQCILILFVSGPLFSSQADSLFRVLERSKEDSLKVNTLLSLAATYYRSNPDSAILYAEQAISLAVKIQFTRGLAYAYKGRGMGFYFQGKYAEALNDWEISLDYFRKINDLLGVSNMLNNLGAVYYNYGDNN